MTSADTESPRPDSGKRYDDESVGSSDVGPSALSARHETSKQGQVPELRRGGTSAGQRHSDFAGIPRMDK